VFFKIRRAPLYRQLQESRSNLSSFECLACWGPKGGKGWKGVERSTTSAREVPQSREPAARAAAPFRKINICVSLDRQLTWREGGGGRGREKKRETTTLPAKRPFLQQRRDEREGEGEMRPVCFADPRADRISISQGHADPDPYAIAVRYSTTAPFHLLSDAIQFRRLLAVSAGHKRQRARRDSALNGMSLEIAIKPDGSTSTRRSRPWRFSPLADRGPPRVIYQRDRAVRFLIARRSILIRGKRPGPG